MTDERLPAWDIAMPAPGTLKPDAIRVLLVLEHARLRTMSAPVIMMKLATDDLNYTYRLLWSMHELGLVEPDRYSPHMWTLATHLAVRP